MVQSSGGSQKEGGGLHKARVSFSLASCSCEARSLLPGGRGGRHRCSQRGCSIAWGPRAHRGAQAPQDPCCPLPTVTLQRRLSLFRVATNLPEGPSRGLNLHSAGLARWLPAALLRPRGWDQPLTTEWPLNPISQYIPLPATKVPPPRRPSRSWSQAHLPPRSLLTFPPSSKDRRNQSICRQAF